MARLRAILLASSLPASMLTALLPAAAAAQDPTAFDEGIVEISADRLGAFTTVVLVDTAGNLLLPLQGVAEFIGIVLDRQGGIIRMPALDGTAVIDVDRAVITLANGDALAAQAGMQALNGTVFVGTSLLAALLQAGVDVDMSRLTVRLQRTVPFPAQQRILAAERRTLQLARQRQLAQKQDRDTASVPLLTSAGVLDWELGTMGSHGAQLTTARLHGGAALLAGDLNAALTLQSGSVTGSELRDVAIRYQRAFPNFAPLRQVSAGSIITRGLFSRFVRGVELTNRPLHRTGDLGDVLIDPDLPSGWQYEVSQGGRLIGYTDATADMPVAVPLRIGATPVQVRMYGPAGEEIVSTLLLQAPVSLLPARVFEYVAGGGACSASMCDEIAYGDARYGVNPWLTVGGGFEHVGDSTASVTRPYAVASMSSGVRATAELQLMPGAHYNANIGLFPRRGSSANIRAGIAQPGFGRLSALPQSESRWNVESYWDQRVDGGLPGLPGLRSIRGGAAAGGTTGRGLTRWRISAAASYARAHFETRFEHDELAITRDVVSMRATGVVTARAARSTFRPVLSAAAGGSRDGFVFVEGGASIQPVPNQSLSAGVQWNRVIARPTLSLAWTARFAPAQVAARAIAARDAGSTALLMSGSLAVAPDGAVSARAVNGAGYAGLHGTVFLDRDGDGVFSASDVTVPFAEVIAGNVHVTADAHGNYRVWGLKPLAPVTVAFDSTAAADPSWTMLGPPPVVRPIPNAARRVDLPLVETRELIGSVTAATGVVTVAGVTIEIIDSKGDVVTTTTFYDGQFYVSRIRPGAYRVRVAATSLSALDARIDSGFIDFVVPAAGDDVVELAPLHLVR